MILSDKKVIRVFLLFQCIYSIHTYVLTDVQTTCRHTERQVNRHKHTHKHLQNIHIYIYTYILLRNLHIHSLFSQLKLHGSPLLSHPFKFPAMAGTECTQACLWDTLGPTDVLNPWENPRKNAEKWLIFHIHVGLP